MIRPVSHTGHDRPVYGFTGRGLLVGVVCLAVALGLGIGGAVAFFKTNDLAHANSHLIHTGCLDNRQLAEVERKELRTVENTNHRLLPKANIPGISHQQLLELSHHQEAERAFRLAVLLIIERRACDG